MVKSLVVVSGVVLSFVNAFQKSVSKGCEQVLLQEKMESTDFSPNEKIVVDFIMNKQENIENYSTTMIAKETYTSPSVLVRIAKKLNFDGWT